MRGFSPLFSRFGFGGTDQPLVSYSGPNSCLSLNEQEWGWGGPNVQLGTDCKERRFVYTSQHFCDTGSVVNSILCLVV